MKEPPRKIGLGKYFANRELTPSQMQFRDMCRRSIKRSKATPRTVVLKDGERDTLDRMKRDGFEVSAAYLAQVESVNRRTIQRRLKTLLDFGYVKKRGDNYAITPAGRLA